MTDGIILIDKPIDMTSFGVVARVRRVLSKENGKKVKVGHTGTLDPFASGLMILVIGNECKNAGSYSKLDKIYKATITLGSNSTTGDIEGEFTKVSDKVPTIDQISKVCLDFVGEISQKPPIYSAIKINGQRAYNIARSGKTIDMPERKVTIHNLNIDKYDYPNLDITVHVSSGTYIRSLAQDIGEALGVGGYCSSLRRIKIAKWQIEDAKKLDEFGIID